jgi:hypothetical protein
MPKACFKIGAKVSGERGKVLDKGDFTEANKKESVFGTVSAQLGVGRGRKWTVVWETVKNQPHYQLEGDGVA